LKRHQPSNPSSTPNPHPNRTSIMGGGGEMNEPVYEPYAILPFVELRDDKPIDIGPVRFCRVVQGT